MFRYVNQTLLAWAMRKYKRFKAHKVNASHFLERLVRDHTRLFVHWRIGMTGTFARWERCEARASCTVLREAGGEIPPAYSPATRLKGYALLPKVVLRVKFNDGIEVSDRKLKPPPPDPARHQDSAIARLRPHQLQWRAGARREVSVLPVARFRPFRSWL